MSSSTFGRALDTSDQAWQAQVDRWRAMTPDEKAQLAMALYHSTIEMMEAGIATRYPQASPRERFLRRAMLTLGRELAVQVYPDAADLAD